MLARLIVLLMLAAVGLAGPIVAGSASAGDAGFCARLRRQTDAAKVGFRTIRGEFRAGRTASGLLVTRTYSNVELFADTACFFSAENGDILHSCETGFDQDDAAAKLRRDALVAELRVCLARELKGAPVLTDAAVHAATLPLTGNRALSVAVNVVEKLSMRCVTGVSTY